MIGNRPRPQRRQPHALERIDALHSALSQLVLEGAGLDRIAAEITRLLGVGVVVTSSDGRERGACLTDEQRQALVAADLVDPSGRIRFERVPDPESTAGEPHSGAADGEVRQVKVTAAGVDLIRLVGVATDRPITADDVSALQRAATVVALLVTQQQAVAAVENKYRGDFLRDVFLGRAADAEFVIEHARGLGWELDRPMVVLSAELDPLSAAEQAAASPQQRRHWQDRFSAAWRLVCDAKGRAIPTVDFSTEVAALLRVPADGTEAERDQQLRRQVGQLVDEVAGDRGGGRRPFSVGVSRVVTELTGLPSAYHQARRATVIGRRISGGRSTTWFDDLGLHRLIALVPDEAELEEFAGDVLGELAVDTPEAKDLRTTLQVLLDTNLNVAEAARLQFFHYNTMRYRIGKLERLLGPFTSDPNLRLNVAVALQVLDFRH